MPIARRSPLVSVSNVVVDRTTRPRTCALLVTIRRLSRDQRQVVQVAAEFADSDEWAAAGSPTAAHWIAQEADIEVSTAREWIRVGRCLRDLPASAAAFAQGVAELQQSPDSHQIRDNRQRGRADGSGRPNPGRTPRTSHRGLAGANQQRRTTPTPPTQPQVLLVANRTRRHDHIHRAAGAVDGRRPHHTTGTSGDEIHCSARGIRPLAHPGPTVRRCGRSTGRSRLGPKKRRCGRRVRGGAPRAGRRMHTRRRQPDPGLGRRTGGTERIHSGADPRR